MSNKPSIFSGFYIYWSRVGAPARVALATLALSLVSLPIALTAIGQSQSGLRPQATNDETADIQICIDQGGSWEIAPDQCLNLCPESTTQNVCNSGETYTCVCPVDYCWNGNSCTLYPN